jgi:hypothetical protein
MKRRTFLQGLGCAVAALTLTLKAPRVAPQAAHIARNLEVTPGLTDAHSFRNLFMERAGYLDEVMREAYDERMVEMFFSEARPAPSWRYGKWKELEKEENHA